MRVSVLIFLTALALPRRSYGDTPRGGGAGLAKAAAELCREGDGSLNGLRAAHTLKQAGVPAVAALVTALSSPKGCATFAAALLADIVCDKLPADHGSTLSPAFAPVRAALESSDRRRVAAGLAALGAIGDPEPDEEDEEEEEGESDSYEGKDVDPPLQAPDRTCPAAEALLQGSLPVLDRLLKRARGPRRLEVLSLVERLKLREIGGPLVGTLITCLDDEKLRPTAVAVLGSIGREAGPAAERLGELLAQAGDPAAEAALANALAAIGRPAAVALPRLRPRLARAAAEICGADARRFPALLEAASRIGPAPGETQEQLRADLAAAATTALARLKPPCRQLEGNEILAIVTLMKLPLTPDSQAALTAVMIDETRPPHARFVAAQALLKLGARLPPDVANKQGQLLLEPRGRELLPPAVYGRLYGGGQGPLSKGELVKGMNAVRGKIADCYARFQTPGIAMVNVVIGRDGRVSSATVTGKLAGTPTGACVGAAVKTATFPPSGGLVTPYPFLLK